MIPASPLAEVPSNSGGDIGKGVLQLTRSQYCPVELPEGADGRGLPVAVGFSVFFWKNSSTGSEGSNPVLKTC